VIVTTLPDCATPDCEFRWTNRGQYNEKHKGKRQEIRANPFRYWRAIWAKELQGNDLSRIVLLNIDCGKVVRTVLASSQSQVRNRILKLLVAHSQYMDGRKKFKPDERNKVSTAVTT
jgi:hypothetical protein